MAFTLIELLVVIAIIAILAAAVVGGASKAGSMMKKKRVAAEMAVLVNAIENYKDKIGGYPPDNPQDPTTPPLFYELIGTTTASNSTFYTNSGYSKAIAVPQVDWYFKRGGFQNSSVEGGEVHNFFPGGLKKNQYAEITPTNDIEVLIVSVPGPGYTNRDGLVTNINPWRYKRSGTLKNPGKYDLWAEVVIGNQTNIIGNWKQ